jgi:hypothetical protein
LLLGYRIVGESAVIKKVRAGLRELPEWQFWNCHSGGAEAFADESKQIGLFLESALHFVNGNQVKTNWIVS